MTDVQIAPADKFSIEVSFKIMKNGELFSTTMTDSHGMDQSRAVIVQQVCVGAIQQSLFKLGAAAASAKDPDFEAKYNEVRSLVTTVKA
jgi:hypothetical protein